MIEPQNAQEYVTSNQEHVVQGVIQLRLDTQPMLDSIEAFLRGRRMLGYDQQTFKPVYGPIGSTKANEEGIQTIMSWITPLFSPHTVQGNYSDRDELNGYLCYVQKGLAKVIMANREEWEIKRQDYCGIIRFIMCTAEPFFSRLIQNKERESYQSTVRTVETNRQEVPSSNGFFGMFSRGGGPR
jgi:hypothetical protein